MNAVLLPFVKRTLPPSTENNIECTILQYKVNQLSFLMPFLSKGRHIVYGWCRGHSWCIEHRRCMEHSGLVYQLGVSHPRALSSIKRENGVVEAGGTGPCRSFRLHAHPCRPTQPPCRRRTRRPPAASSIWRLAFVYSRPYELLSEHHQVLFEIY